MSDIGDFCENGNFPLIPNKEKELLLYYCKERAFKTFEKFCQNETFSTKEESVVMFLMNRVKKFSEIFKGQKNSKYPEPTERLERMIQYWFEYEFFISAPITNDPKSKKKIYSEEFEAIMKRLSNKELTKQLQNIWKYGGITFLYWQVFEKLPKDLHPSIIILFKD
ncbi:hypothetical protein G9A89_008111 [Geosiphon pyriformis]|nr:hypothetical protein G9A89_008111 [Geosiphon pyriformis]